MDDNFSVDSRFLFSNHLSCLGDFLERFTETSAFGVNIVELGTQKTLLCNAVCSKKWGLEPQEQYKKTVKESFERVQNFKNKANVLKSIEEKEEEALQLGQSNHTYAVLRHDGIVGIQNSIIVPVFSTRHQPVAIVYIARDLTRSTNLLHLFEYYEKYYPKKSEAVQYSSQYLQLDKYFQFPLTYSELSLLLAMTEDIRHKKIAHIRKISVKTVESQISALKDKLKTGIDIHLVMANLRSRQQWISEIELY